MLQLPLGRNKKFVVPERLEELAAQGLTLPEIAKALEMGLSTLQRNLANSVTLAAHYAAGLKKFEEKSEDERSQNNR